MRYALLVFLCSFRLLAQDPAPTPAPTPAPKMINYFGETGASYDYYAQTPASITGFGLRIGNSSGWSVTDVITGIGKGAPSAATIETGLEYHVAEMGLWEFLGLASAGVTTDGTVTLGNFSGGAGVGYDMGSLITKGKISLPLVFRFKITAITGTQVKPVYVLTFRKTF